jgi:hypothetical protein
MIEMFLIGGSVSILLIIIVSFIVSSVIWKLQYSRLKSIQKEQQAWQRTQEVFQQRWEIQQERRKQELEKKLTEQVQKLYDEWNAWKARDAERVAALSQQYYTAEQQLRIELELAHLPYIEEAPLIPLEHHSWKPAKLRGANLSHHDLSHRYLGKADLRNANLAYANLFMADLSDACLAGANLTGADLSGANLTNADLHDAMLVETNLLVTDLNNALLKGANLLGARNLTIAQLHEAIYDQTTQLDLDVDIILPQIPHPPSHTDQPSSSDRGKEMATDSMLAVVSLQPGQMETPRPSEYPEEREPTLGEPEQEIAVSSPAASDDNPVEAVERRPLEDTPESPRTGESDTNPPRRKRNGRRQARAN